MLWCNEKETYLKPVSVDTGLNMLALITFTNNLLSVGLKQKSWKFIKKTKSSLKDTKSNKCEQEINRQKSVSQVESLWYDTLFGKLIKIGCIRTYRQHYIYRKLLSLDSQISKITQWTLKSFLIWLILPSELKLSFFQINLFLFLMFHLSSLKRFTQGISTTYLYCNIFQYLYCCHIRFIPVWPLPSFGSKNFTLYYVSSLPCLFTNRTFATYIIRFTIIYILVLMI